MRTKITHVEERYQHFAIETAEQNRANLFDKIVTGRPNAYVPVCRLQTALAVPSRVFWPRVHNGAKILRDHHGPW